MSDQITEVVLVASCAISAENLDISIFLNSVSKCYKIKKPLFQPNQNSMKDWLLLILSELQWQLLSAAVTHPTVPGQIIIQNHLDKYNNCSRLMM